MTAGSSGVCVTCASFLVRKDGGNDGLHVAAHIAAVVGEDRRDAGDICGAGIAGHEMLDELAADEGTDIGMGEDVGKRAVEVLLRRFGRRGEWFR